MQSNPKTWAWNIIATASNNEWTDNLLIRVFIWSRKVPPMARKSRSFWRSWPMPTEQSGPRPWCTSHISMICVDQRGAFVDMGWLAATSPPTSRKRIGSCVSTQTVDSFFPIGDWAVQLANHCFVGRIPVIIDNSVSPPFPVMETSAELLYLQKFDKDDKFGFTDEFEKNESLQWLFFWHGSGAPYQGNLGFFRRAAEKLPCKSRALQS